jgi:hypothetical protein
MQDWTIIIQTFGNKLPHLDTLRKYNSGEIHICNGPKYRDPERKKFWWRNCDLTLRNFWKENRGKIKGNKIAVIEYDVLVNKRLPDFEPDGVFFPEVICEKDDPTWHWWREKSRINPSYQTKQLKIIGCRPWAVGFWQREALDALADKRWDYLFNYDLFCELRSPTVVLNSGFSVSSFPLTNVGWTDTVYKDFGDDIYHPVKDSL